MRNESFVARRTSFVEVMIPCFSRSFFIEALPTFELSRSGTGIGLDYLWPRMLDYQDIWIFDEAPVRHTRPVGKIRYQNSVLQAIESRDLHYVLGFGIEALNKTMIGICGDGAVLHAKQPKFVNLYHTGYTYLAKCVRDIAGKIDRDTNAPVPGRDDAVHRKIRRALRHAAGSDITISRGKPSLTSSVSCWSWTSDPRLEATGGNDGRLNGMCGFHTKFELKPWWQVDLGKPHIIESIAVYNRLDYPSRCIDFDIMLSDTGADWTLIHAKRDGIRFGGLDGNPFRCSFAGDKKGHFVRLQLSGMGYLHLDQIEVFGTPL